MTFNGSSSSRLSFAEAAELGCASVRSCFHVIATRPRLSPGSMMLPVSSTFALASGEREISFRNSSGQFSERSESEAKIVGGSGSENCRLGGGAGPLAWLGGGTANGALGGDSGGGGGGIGGGGG